nr:putative late blight resistance protein homolog R1B-14 [Ipomoea trifida]
MDVKCQGCFKSLPDSCGVWELPDNVVPADWLAQTVEQNAALILGIKDQVEDLVRELRSFQAYLTEAARNESWKDNAVLVEVERSIRNVARDAEDAIDKYIVERRIHKAKPAPKR